MKAKVGDRVTMKVRTIMGFKGSGVIVDIWDDGPDPTIHFQKYKGPRIIDDRETRFLSWQHKDCVCCLRSELVVHRRV